MAAAAAGSLSTADRAPRAAPSFHRGRGFAQREQAASFNRGCAGCAGDGGKTTASTRFAYRYVRGWKPRKTKSQGPAGQTPGPWGEGGRRRQSNARVVLRKVASLRIKVGVSAAVAAGSRPSVGTSAGVGSVSVQRAFPAFPAPHPHPPQAPRSYTSPVFLIIKVMFSL